MKTLLFLNRFILTGPSLFAEEKLMTWIGPVPLLFWPQKIPYPSDNEKGGFIDNAHFSTPSDVCRVVSDW
jgi:hypothetical protein